MNTSKFCRITWFVASLLILVLITSIRPVKADSAALVKYGINDHLQRYTDYDAACDEIIASGIKWVRISPDWGSIEPSSGAYNSAYLAKVDAIVNKLTSHDVNVLFILCYTAPWASSNPSSPDAGRYKPANWGYWANYVNYICTRYNNKITHWEVWNEPDLSGFWKSSAADYVTLLQTAATEIRAVNPNNKILLGGLALYNGTTASYGPGTFFDTILGLGAASSFDIVNYHAYADSAHYITVYNAMQTVMALHGISSRKLWVTETGYTTVGDAAKEANKADMVDQTFLTHTSLPNIDKVFWYVHRNTSTSNASEDNFGLITNNRTPIKALYFHNASGGAETDFKLAKDYPTQTPTRRTLAYYQAPTGDGSYVVDYAADGSTKRIPANTYMYCRVNDNWLLDGNGGLDGKVYVDVTYLNSGTGLWALQYDANSNAYYGTGMSRTKTNTGAWLTETFTLNDVKFANRQNYLSDFRLYSATADLIVSKIRVRKEMDKATVVLGTTDRFRLAERPNDTNPAYEAYNPVATIGGRECRQITGNSKFIYMKVSNGLIRSGHTNVKIAVQFWDSGTDNLLVQYNATSNAHKPLYITKTNTNTWRTVTLTITDANFNNSQSYSADLRISNAFDGSTESISRVETYRY